MIVRMHEHVSKDKFHFRFFNNHVLISNVVKERSIRGGCPGDVYFLGGGHHDGEQCLWRDPVAQSKEGLECLFGSL